MRRSLGLFAIFAMLTTTALAAEAEGRITAVDSQAMTITLEDGKTYKLPGEVDVEALAEGMEILIAYDTVGGENMITDMQVFE